MLRTRETCAGTIFVLFNNHSGVLLVLEQIILAVRIAMMCRIFPVVYVQQGDFLTFYQALEYTRQYTGIRICTFVCPLSLILEGIVTRK